MVTAGKLPLRTTTTPDRPLHNSRSPRSCPFCSCHHQPLTCPLPIPDRYYSAIVRNKCLNCLGPYHPLSGCRSHSCYQCGEQHHSALHRRPLATANSKHRLPRCPFCHLHHSPHKCHLPVLFRLQQVEQRRLCINCLSPRHSEPVCTSHACHTCGDRHHTALHESSEEDRDRDDHSNDDNNDSNLMSNTTSHNYDNELDNDNYYAPSADSTTKNNENGHDNDNYNPDSDSSTDDNDNELKSDDNHDDSPTDDDADDPFTDIAENETNFNTLNPPANNDVLPAWQKHHADNMDNLYQNINKDNRNQNDDDVPLQYNKQPELLEHDVDQLARERASVKNEQPLINSLTQERSPGRKDHTEEADESHSEVPKEPVAASQRSGSHGNDETSLRSTINRGKLRPTDSINFNRKHHRNHCFEHSPIV